MGFFEEDLFSITARDGTGVDERVDVREALIYWPVRGCQLLGRDQSYQVGTGTYLNKLFQIY